MGTSFHGRRYQDGSVWLDGLAASLGTIVEEARRRVGRLGAGAEFAGCSLLHAAPPRLPSVGLLPAAQMARCALLEPRAAAGC